MEEFYNRYIRLCKESRVAPLNCVTSHFLQSPTNDIHAQRILDLSSCNFTPEDCSILAKVLAYDVYFKEVSFKDCLLSEDASKILLYGLASSRTLESIDLKGNNLRCSGAEIVGIFLKKNISVRCLRLDWNALGVWGSGVTAIAESLSVNQSLVLLDLRNNQISHEGATQLANCLRRNSTLKGLDMRWNNVGLLGGRAFLSCLQYNKTLTSLELQGNNIPEDILKAINVAVKVNKDQEYAMKEENARTEKIMKKMEQIELEKKVQVSMLQEKLEEQTNANNQLNKSSHSKISQLREALELNRNSFNEVSKQLNTTKSELKESGNKYAALEDSLQNLKNELVCEKDKNNDLTNELMTERKIKSKLEDKIAEMDKQLTEIKDIRVGLEKEIEKLKKEYKLQMNSQEEEQRRRNEELQKTDKEKERILKNKLECAEKDKNIIEEKASELRTEIVTVKLQSKEELVNLRSELKHEQLINSKQFEEKIEALRLSKDELQNQVTKYVAQISELQTQLNIKTKEYEQSKMERENLVQQMLKKENDHTTAVSQLNVEKSTEKRTNEDLRNRISNLETELKENMMKQKDMICKKNQEIKNLEEKLESRELDLKRQREEEVRRAELLESAIFTYVSSARSSRPHSPSK